MKIFVSKNFSEDNKNIIFAAIDSAIEYAPLADINTIRVRPTKEHENFSGHAQIYGKTAHIAIEQSEDSDDFLDTIFHEFYHLHQFSNKTLEPIIGGFKYKGHYIPIWFYTLFYPFIPFERQAVKFARKMVKAVKRLE